MKRTLGTILAVLCLLGVSSDAFAQYKNRKFRRRSTARKKSVRRYLGSSFFQFKKLQSFEPYMYVGGGLNALNYFGDLAPVNTAISTDFSFTRPGFGGFYGIKFHQSAAVRANYNFGILRGDDFSADPNLDNSSLSRYQRNLSFRNMIHEVSLNLELSVFPEVFGKNERPFFNAHLLVGVSLFYHNPQGKAPAADYQVGEDAPLPAGLTAGDWVNLQPLDTEGQNFVLDENGNAFVPAGAGPGYSRFQLGLPVGISAVSHLTNELSVGLEFSIRFTFTDYLDDVSGTYMNVGAFEDPIARIFSDRSVEPMAAVKGQTRFPQGVTAVTQNGETYRINGVVGSGVQGSVRGNPDVNDHFFMTQIKIMYSLGFY